jgi:hypothetical protein
MTDPKPLQAQESHKCFELKRGKEKLQKFHGNVDKVLYFFSEITHILLTYIYIYIHRIVHNVDISSPSYLCISFFPCCRDGKLWSLILLFLTDRQKGYINITEGQLNQIRNKKL